MIYSWEISNSETNEKETSFDGLQIPAPIANILVKRKLSDPNKLQDFIHPDYERLYDPFLMDHMHLAVDRIVSALENGDNILIYGDYDVDGVTSVSILYDSLHQLGGKVTFFIPDRSHEGYGVSSSAIKKAAKRNVKLIISVDCGITANEEVQIAASYGIDFIVCDHHEPVGEVPNALAVLDPKKKNCTYPFRELAGCGVAFKLLQGLCQKLELPASTFLQYLDLVAIGTAADIVQVTGENRILVYHGLMAINKSPRVGLRALLTISGLSRQTITVSLIVFVIAPRINAVGRISKAKKAVHLLTAKSEQQAKNIAQILNFENNKRRDIDEFTLKQAEEIIAKEVDLEKTRVLVLNKEDWHLGVIGIIASRIHEKYNRPAILISTHDGIGKASGRSGNSFNIFLALKDCDNLLLSFGGHACAAGLTIREDKIAAFRHKLNQIAVTQQSDDDRIHSLAIDSLIDFSNLSASFLKWLKRMAPFGPGNMRPVFVTRNVSISGSIRRLGANHIKFKSKQNGIVIDTVAFNMMKYKQTLEEPCALFDIVYVIEESNWQGQNTVQLRMKDFEAINGTN